MAGIAHGLASAFGSLTQPSAIQEGSGLSLGGSISHSAIVWHALCTQNRAVTVGTVANPITMRKNQGHVWWHGKRKQISESHDSLICIVNARPARAMCLKKYHRAWVVRVLILALRRQRQVHL